MCVKLMASITLMILITSCNNSYDDFSVIEKRNNFFSTEACKKEHFQNFLNYAKNELEFKNEKLIKSCYKYQVNLKKTKELENRGIDLSKEIRKYGNHSYIRLSFLANTIVEGKILEVNKLDDEKRNYFTKSYKIQINKIFKKGKNWTGSKIIDVKTSGYLSHSPYFYSKKGDNTLLFLNLAMRRPGYEDEILENTYSLWGEFKIRKMENGFEIRGAGNRDSVFNKIKLIQRVNDYNDFIDDFSNEECVNFF